MARGDGYRTAQLDLCREKIKVSQLLNVLQNNALKGKTLDPVRQRSCEILLRKALPDLSQTEVVGSVATYVARLPTPAVDVTAWTASLEDSSPLALPSQPIDIVDMPQDSISGGTENEPENEPHTDDGGGC